MTLQLALVTGLAGVWPMAAQSPPPAAHPGLVRVQADTPEARAVWDRRLARMVATGALKVRERRAAEPGAVRDEWLQQLHKGVPVVGADVWRRVDGGVLVAAEGVIFERIALNPVPALTRAEARAAITALTPGSAGPSRPPELVVLPTDPAGFALAYRARVFTGTELTVYYLDASTGAVIRRETADGPPPAAGR